MLDLLKNNRLPVIVSVVALILATYLGFIPIRQNASTSASASVAEITALKDRISALEAASEGQAPAVASIPAGADNARLRQEIDLITRGLGNQTGRVSRIKKVVEGITDDAGRALPAATTLDEIALAKRGLVNLTRRINALSDRMDALDTAADDIVRLQQQMAIVDRAFARVAAKSNAAREERAALVASLNNVSRDTAASATTQPADLEEIATKLDEILEQLEN